MSTGRITPGVLYRTVLLAFGLVVAGLVFRELASLVLAIMIVVIIALPLSSAATALQRLRVPRALGALLTLLLFLAAIGALIAAIVPVFTHEINQFVHDLPSIVDSLRHKVGRITGTSPSHIGQQVQHFADSYTRSPGKLLGPLESIGASVVAGVAAVIVVLLTALYSAIHPEPLVDGFIRVFPPRRRPHAAHVLRRLRVAYIAWLRGLLVGMVLLGGLTYVGLLLVGLPFAAFFAVFTAVAMIVPYYGALVSSIPPILYALTFSPGKALIVALIYVGAHQLEGNVVQPLVVARNVELHPAVVAVGVVAVDQLFGFVGLFVAVPILATIKILLEELWIHPRERDERRLPVDGHTQATASVTPVVAGRQGAA